MSVEAGALTIWSRQIFEANILDLIQRGCVAGWSRRDCKRSFEIVSEKAADFSAAFVRIRPLSAASVATGADSDANAGRADADAATFPIAAALDMTPAAMSISV